VAEEIANKIIESGERCFAKPTRANIEAHKRTCKLLWNLAEIKGIRHEVMAILTRKHQQNQ